MYFMNGRFGDLFENHSKSEVTDVSTVVASRPVTWEDSGLQITAVIKPHSFFACVFLLLIIRYFMLFAYFCLTTRILYKDLRKIVHCLIMIFSKINKPHFYSNSRFSTHFSFGQIVIS